MADETEQGEQHAATAAETGEPRSESGEPQDGQEPDFAKLREDDGQDYIDRSALDFDPDDGLLSGTAVDGTSNIPGPHEKGDDTTDEDLEGTQGDPAETST